VAFCVSCVRLSLVLFRIKVSNSLYIFKFAIAMAVRVDLTNNC
jgi:hypothetical protein